MKFVLAVQNSSPKQTFGGDSFGSLKLLNPIGPLCLLNRWGCSGTLPTLTCDFFSLFVSHSTGGRQENNIQNNNSNHMLHSRVKQQSWYRCVHTCMITRREILKIQSGSHTRREPLVAPHLLYECAHQLHTANNKQY